MDCRIMDNDGFCNMILKIMPTINTIDVSTTLSVRALILK